MGSRFMSAPKPCPAQTLDNSFSQRYYLNGLARLRTILKGGDYESREGVDR